MAILARSISRRPFFLTLRSSYSAYRPEGDPFTWSPNAFVTLEPTRRSTVHRPVTTKAAIPQNYKLEVERKFVPDSVLISQLKRNNLWPGPEPVSLTTPAKGLRFTDTYFDTPAFCLRNAGIYVRQRNSEWEMKARQTGDLVSSGCIEVQGQAQVETYLREKTLGASLADLRPVAKMETVRHAWIIGEFVVAVDDTMLLLEEGTRVSHRVGEVELCGEIGGENEEVEMQRMTERVNSFVERYAEVFRGNDWETCSQVPEGKLAAFFRWREVVSEKGFVRVLGASE